MPGNRHLIIGGIALVALLPLALAVAGVCACLTPREYLAQCVVDPLNIEPAAFHEAFTAAAQPYEPAVQIHGLRNSGMFQIGVYSPSPQAAADHANGIALALQHRFKTEIPSAEELLRQADSPAPVADSAAASPAEKLAALRIKAAEAARLQLEAEKHAPRVQIWEKAEPPSHVARPDLPQYLLIALGVSVLPAIVGGVLVIIAALPPREIASSTLTRPSF
jgi:capsular polysaccharide biosynthesis protein